MVLWQQKSKFLEIRENSFGGFLRNLLMSLLAKVSTEGMMKAEVWSSSCTYHN